MKGEKVIIIDVRKKELRKKKIIKIAIELFRKNGYENITFADIASNMGKGRTTIYEYFSNKEEIIIIYLKEQMTLYFIDAIKALSSELPLEEIIYEFICLQVKYSPRHRMLQRFMEIISSQGSEQGKKLLADIKERHKDLSVLLFKVIERERKVLRNGITAHFLSQFIYQASSNPIMAVNMTEEELAREITTQILFGCKKNDNDDNKYNLYINN